jgi:hypothetical protein
MCANAFCWHTACQRRGGNPPAPAFPRRGKRERGRSFLAAAGSSRWRGADGRRAGRVCARSTITFLSITITKPYGSIRSFRFPEVLLAPPTPLPCFYPHSQMGRKWARCKLGSDLKPRPVTMMVTDLGCWVLPSLRRSLKGSVGQTQSPEHGGGCLRLTKLLDLCWPPRYQLTLALLPSLASRMRLLLI